MKKNNYIVSACLIGRPCCYDGKPRTHEFLKEQFEQGGIIALCPEELGGLKTPRPPCEIFSGTGKDVLEERAYIFNKEGKEITYHIVKGCREFVRIARENNITQAIMKARSPSCGKGAIYDGTFSGRLREGNGVAVELLLQNNFTVSTDEEINEKFFLNEKTSTNAKSRKPQKRKAAKTARR